MKPFTPRLHILHCSISSISLNSSTVIQPDPGYIHYNIAVEPLGHRLNTAIKNVLCYSQSHKCQGPGCQFRHNDPAIPVSNFAIQTLLQPYMNSCTLDGFGSIQ
ncbi:hypothetical protein GDO78_005371 [Eleutherodactylus coqui]|uniref:Uncharacterized protein n=1 Tax=Eleutherodactylus coqui TaxID=57060 RepID=A0A8J6FMH0_ELECQ|nr:hypothetical protein GDO78_005371 [Eleutherodactylus coqui]